jgi:hypothetical protein
MSGKWYRSRNIQAALITGVFVLIAAIITSPLWLRGSKKFQIDVGTNRTSPISLQIIPNVSREKMDSVLVAMRHSQKLRELTPLETGKSISETPSGTFFLVFSLYLTHAEGRLSEMLQRSAVARLRDIESDFEVHYVSEGTIFLVAFVSTETASGISRLDGATKTQVTLSPVPWESIETLVLVPLDRIIEAKARQIQTTDAGEVDVLDVIVQ